MWYTEFKLTCTETKCDKQKPLTWNKDKRFYYCNECNKTFKAKD